LEFPTPKCKLVFFITIWNLEVMLPTGQNYDEVCARFRWDIPERFNIAAACCDDWAEREQDRVALIAWHPDAPAVTTTYSQLCEMSDRLAAHFLRTGLVAGDRVGIILPQSVETVVSHLAIYKAGLVAVPLARLFAPDAIQYRLARAGAKAVIVNADSLSKIETVRDRLPDLGQVLVTEGYSSTASRFSDALAGNAAGFVRAQTGPDTPALIIFTSGTTGQAKGALHGHRVLLGHIPGVQFHHEWMPLPGDIAWTPADWAWAGGLLNILLPCLYLGVPVVHGGLERFDPEIAFRLMSEMGVRNAFIPPTALRLMRTVEKPASRFPLKLRTIGSGGESLGRDTFLWAREELGVAINEFYGQTECNLVLSSCSALGVSLPGAIGKPVPGHRVAVIRSDGTICAPGERGEVAVARPDPVMFLGYFGDEEATARKFVGDWMKTGDQSVVDADGYFHFVGRDDDIINSAGYRVGPGEIEDCLTSHPAIKLAVAVAKPDPLRTEIVKAYVVLKPGYLASETLRQEIRQHVKAGLAANIFPREIDFVEDIPLTTTGKVIRRVFREQAREEASKAR
jgi:acetyl-CoA synthetase